ncbi:MAG: xanthine dehydrogenase family protein molybdopterin-binding subunit [Cyanobacteria bacterium P01_H01_bin.21]
MNQVIGSSVSRQDGRAKVTGTATYSAEHQIPNLAYGYLVTATIASGRIRAIDTREAEQASSVITVFTHRNAPQVFNPDESISRLSESRLPLSDDRVHYAGQIIGLAVANTFERAREAAHLVKVEYEPQAPIVEANRATYSPAPQWLREDLTYEQIDENIGDVTTALATAETQLEAVYTTSTELHAPMEPHAIIAHWQPDTVTIYEPTQAVLMSQRTYADLLGLPTERVRIVSTYIGGAFGCKFLPWPHSILCAAAARELNRPLKVVVSRRQMTMNTGHRSETEQMLRLGALADGKLQVIEHTARSVTSPLEDFPEACTIITPVMYAAPNMRLAQELAPMNVGSPTFMRAPGECPGMWALESAMDELAWSLKIDPIQLRLINQTEQHQRKNLPFSAKYFAECLEVGAQQFGWQDRPMQVRSLTRDGKLVGLGMASTTFPGYRGSTSAKVRLLPDGTAHVMSAGNDMGTGAYTVVAMTAAETLGIPVDKVRVELGDSTLPDGGVAGGSQMTASLMPAVKLACEDVLRQARSQSAQQASEKLKQSGRAAFEATASAAPGEEREKFSFQSWGAHFCELIVDEAIGRVQITRWVSVINAGRIMNPKTAASQIRGGVIMGIGTALMEEGHFDPNTGYPVVYDLATYHYPTHADIPHIDVTFVGEPDFNFNPMGVRGIGEIGINGVSAAISNAIYHATGKRLRDLPMTPDKLLEGV